MTILKTVYASAPIDEVILLSLEIVLSASERLRFVQGFEDHVLGGELYEAASISVALPSHDTTGQQTLRFAIGGVNHIIQRYIQQALESNEPVKLIFREYLASDKSTPARQPYVMEVSGGQLEGDEAQFEASYYDLLNTAWPRERYTEETAPAIKYL